jgi:phosphate/sulfate permease
MILDLNTIYLIIGFLIAVYAIVANDSIQTLGLFLTANSRNSWVFLWIFISSILTIVLIYGYLNYNGDPSFGRLEKFPPMETFSWIYILPPIIILILTQYKIPISTTFLIIAIFASWNFQEVLLKSILGYLIAFVFAGFIYFFVSKIFENNRKLSKSEYRNWLILQFISTAFLWIQWLIEDLANIFVYAPAEKLFYKIGIDANNDGLLLNEEFILKVVNSETELIPLLKPELGEIIVYAGKSISFGWLLFSIASFWILQGILFYQRGGAIQKIVEIKINVFDIRSATIINIIFAFILVVFKELSNIPMSTTWVFVGLLAGREIVINFMIKNHQNSTLKATKMALVDLAKILFGLIISIIVAFGIPYLEKFF